MGQQRGTMGQTWPRARAEAFHVQQPVEHQWQQQRHEFEVMGLPRFKTESLAHHQDSAVSSRPAAHHQGSMKLPKFKGDPFWWFLKINKYFVLNNTLPSSMVFIASICMEGEVLVWLNSKNAVAMFTDWWDFTCCLTIGFDHQSLKHQWRLPPKNQQSLKHQ